MIRPSLSIFDSEFLFGLSETNVCFRLNLPQEFSKEVEGRSSLKSSVVSEGNQLLRLKKVDTVMLRSDLARIDAQWTELLTRIPVVQEKLHQVRSHAA